MASTGAAPPGLNVAALSGPVLIGYILNFMLYGTLGVQVYIYYLAFPKDTRVAKCLVTLLYAVETTQTILIIHDAFHTYAFGFLDLSALDNVQINWLSVPVMSGIVSCSVQLFFAFRIWTLSRSMVVTGLVVAISLMQCGAALAAGAQAFQVGSFSELQAVAFVSTSIWLAGSAACDILIAATMTFYLSRRSSVFRATNVLLSKLTRLTVETGMITATVATLDVILFLTFREANYHTVPALILAKLYSNTCLAVLNSRVRIWGGRDEIANSEIMASQTLLSEGSQLKFAKRVVNVQATPPAVDINRPKMSESIPMDSFYTSSQGYINESDMNKSAPMV